MPIEKLLEHGVIGLVAVMAIGFAAFMWRKYEAKVKENQDLLLQLLEQAIEREKRQEAVLEPAKELFEEMMSRRSRRR